MDLNCSTDSILTALTNAFGMIPSWVLRDRKQLRCELEITFNPNE